MKHSFTTYDGVTLTELDKMWLISTHDWKIWEVGVWSNPYKGKDGVKNYYFSNKETAQIFKNENN